MKAVSGKRFCRVLEAQGWKLVRIRGSHLIYMKADSNFLVSVPVHGDTSLKRGLQSHLMKLVGIHESELY